MNSVTLDELVDQMPLGDSSSPLATTLQQYCSEIFFFIFLASLDISGKFCNKQNTKGLKKKLISFL